MTEKEFSLHRCYGILRKAGARQASREAVRELRTAVENMALEISKRAALFADDAARRKVTGEDVRSAVREYLESGISSLNRE